MRQKNQPQTTSNPTVRDAAVQISEGENSLKNNELFHVEPGYATEIDAEAAAKDKMKAAFKAAWEKRQLLIAGAMKTNAQWPNCAAEYALGEMATIVAYLTSADKGTREHGKELARKLVKIGKGE